MHRDVIVRQLEPALRALLGAPRLRLTALRGQRPANDERREPWVPMKYGPASPDDWFGVIPADAEFERAPGRPAEHLTLIVKVTPRKGLARTLIPWIVEHRHIPFDKPYWGYRCAAEFDHTSAREQRMYTL